MFPTYQGDSEEISNLPRWVNRFLATVSRFWNFLFSLSVGRYCHAMKLYLKSSETLVTVLKIY
jgi:hypothetical protein